MKPIIARSLCGFMALWTAGDSLACTVDQVNIIDFRPEMSANGDGSNRFVDIVGTLDNFCPTSTGATLSVSGVDAKGTVLGGFGKTATIDNIPAGGRSFEINAVPYSNVVASYMVTVIATTGGAGADSVPRLPGTAAADNSGHATANTGTTNALNYLGGLSGYNLGRRY